MTETPDPAAVEIAREALRDRHYPGESSRLIADIVVAALARAGRLVDPDYLAALEAVAEAAKAQVDDLYRRSEETAVTITLAEALDAVTASRPANDPRIGERSNHD